MTTAKNLLATTAIVLAVAFILTRANTARAAIVDGTVAYFNFDNNLTDQTATGHDGTYTGGSPLYVASRAGFGQALSLSGTGQYVTIGGPETDFDFNTAATDEFSLSIWFQVDGTWDDTWEAVLVKGEGGAWRLHRSSNSQGVVLTNPGVGSGGSLADGAWHHIAATRDDDRARMYLDGELVSAILTPNTPGNGNDSPRIGSNPNAGNREFGGQVDEVGIWNRALTAREVAGIYDGGAGATIASATAVEPVLWRFLGGDQDGWTLVSGATRSASGGITSQPSNGDASHPTLFLSSPEFRFTMDTLDGTNVLAINLAQGQGNQNNQTFVTPADILGFNGGNSATDGAKGVGLLDMATGEYSKFFYLPGNNTGSPMTLTAVDLAALGATQNDWFRLDFFDNDHGSWGWGVLQAVDLAGTTEAISVIIPEPATLLIWSLLAGLGVGLRWRRRK